MPEREEQVLEQLLEKACPRPAYLASSHGGPVLALALHCRMIEAGFVLGTEAGANPSPEARYMPHRNWNGDYLDQWVFEYTKPGKARKFTLHCSLQARSKRMYIHASEENNQGNTCVLGLQLDNYVPDTAPLRSNRWTGVLREAAKMKALFTQYVTQPLTENAQDDQQPEAPAAPPQQQPAGAGAAAAPGAVGAAVAAAAAPALQPPAVAGGAAAGGWWAALAGGRLQRP
ncbi:hypothetical protein Agub_g5779, partial [Astrephomene gubernaculifera]